MSQTAQIASRCMPAVLLALVLGASVMSWPAAARAELVIRFAHVVARDTPKGLAVERFKQLVEQRSAGQIRVVVYPAARLYSDLDEMEALRLGAVEMLAPSLSKFGRVGFPEFELFALPFLFSQLQDVRRVTQGPIGQRMLTSLARQGMVELGFFDNGAVVANQRFWSSLNPSQRKLLEQAMREALAYGNAIADAENERALRALRAAGTTRTHVLSVQQRAQLRAAVQPAYDQLAARIGTQWTQDVLKALES